MTDDLITTQRVGVVVQRLTLGESATTMEIAEWVGLSRQSTWKMLDKLSSVLPLALIDGQWCSLHGYATMLQCDADD